MIKKINDFGYKKLLCLIVQSESWCGYLLIASQLTINNQDYQIILQEWLQNQFVNMSDIDENDLFEVNLELTDDLHIKSWAQEKADYLELVDVDDQEVLVSFFSIDPKSLVLDANDTFEMLGVPLNITSTDKKSSLSLFLHLPDNKKFILYTPAQQILSSQQKIKLAEKSVEKLYTPLDFQKELNIMKAEDYLNHSVKLIRKVAII